MKKLIYSENGEPLSVLRCEDCVVTPPLAGEIQVRWHSSPVLASDLATIRGLYRFRHITPGVPGISGAGKVVALGENVKNFEVGQTVILSLRKSHPYQFGSWQSIGNYPVGDIMAIPAAYPLEMSPLGEFWTTFVTAWVMTMEIGKASSGDWVVVTAAGSTVGRCIIQLSKIFGFKVIAVVRREEQRRTLLELGAAEVIVTPNEDIVQRVKIITKLKGAQIAIDSIGGEIAGQCLRSLGDNGRMIASGLLAQERYMPIDTKTLIFNTIQITGFWVLDWVNRVDADTRTTVCNKIFHWMKSGQMSVIIQAKYDFADYKTAIQEATKPGIQGRIVFSS